MNDPQPADAGLRGFSSAIAVGRAQHAAWASPQPSNETESRTRRASDPLGRVAAFPKPHRSLWPWNPAAGADRKQGYPPCPSDLFSAPTSGVASPP